MLRHVKMWLSKCLDFSLKNSQGGLCRLRREALPPLGQVAPAVGRADTKLLEDF